MTNRYKITLAIFFILSLLVGARYSYGQINTSNSSNTKTVSTYVTQNANGSTTTTTSKTTTLPIGTTTKQTNTPTLGDITYSSLNQVTTVNTSITNNQNTGNVLANYNFCSTIGGSPVWTGTNVTGGTSDMGCNYLTGKGTTSYAETSAPLTGLGINVVSQAYGFTQSASAKTDFWFSNPMGLTISQSVTNLDTGEIITQNRSMSSNGIPSGNGAGNIAGFIDRPLDNIIIGQKTNYDGTSQLTLGYQSKLRFDFGSSSNNFSGVDVASPSLSISYNYVDQNISSVLVTNTAVVLCWQNTPSTCPPDLTSLNYAPTSLQNLPFLITDKSISANPDFVISTLPPVSFDKFLTAPIMQQQNEKLGIATFGDPMAFSGPMMAPPSPLANFTGPISNLFGADGKSTGGYVGTNDDKASLASKGITAGDGSLGPGKFTYIAPGATATSNNTLDTSKPVATTSTTDGPMSTTPAPTKTVSTADGPMSAAPTKTASTTSNDTTTGGTNANTTSGPQNTTTSKTTDSPTQTTQAPAAQPGTTQSAKTEGSQTQTTNEKSVSDSKTTSTSAGITSTGDAKADAKSASIDAKIKSELAKVDRTLMTVSERTRAIQDIKLDGMKASAADLSSYENKRLQDGKTMVGIPNSDFYKQINISQQQIYKDATLSAYIIKDPIAVKQRLLKEIEDEQNSIILEIEMLKKGIKKG